MPMPTNCVLSASSAAKIALNVAKKTFQSIVPVLHLFRRELYIPVNFETGFALVADVEGCIITRLYAQRIITSALGAPNLG
jgi:hypothetical protein